MERAVMTKRFTGGATKTVITAAGMTGVTIGAYQIKNIVSDVTDNEILGFAAGIATILVGAAVVNKINKGVDKAFDVKALPTSTPITPLIIDVASDNLQTLFKEPEFDLEDLEGNCDD